MSTRYTKHINTTIADIAPGTWCILDDNQVLYSGTQDWMEAAFGYITKGLEELKLEYPGIPSEDLQRSIDKWSVVTTGKLFLVYLQDVKSG